MRLYAVRRKDRTRLFHREGSYNRCAFGRISAWFGTGWSRNVKWNTTAYLVRRTCRAGVESDQGVRMQNVAQMGFLPRY